MSIQSSLCLGWIGLGSMGLAMATNIQKYLTTHNSPALRYWNRTLSRGDTLKEIGGIPCLSPEDLVQNCDIIFISVSDDIALQTLTKTLLSIPSIASKTIVDTTTVHPSTTASIAAQYHAKSASYVAAPVFGSTPVAQLGQLLIAIAGSQHELDTISPFLKGVLARNVIVVGNQPEKALLLKTASNFITAGLMYVLSEAHVLASVSGLPFEILHDLVEQNFGAYAGGVSERLVSGAYCPAKGEAPRSGLELGIKDVGHGVNLAEEKGVRLQVGDLYLEAAKEAKAWGDEEGRSLDSSAVFGIVRTRAGERFESEVVLEKSRQKENPQF